MCLADLEGHVLVESDPADIPIPGTEFGDVTIANFLEDFPQCVPSPSNTDSSCDSNDLVQRSFVDFMGSKGVECDTDSSRCNAKRFEGYLAS